jgi:hypothetical protein
MRPSSAIALAGYLTPVAALCNVATACYSVQVAQYLTVHAELPGQSLEDFFSLDQAVNRLALMDTEHQVAVATLTILTASRSEPPG